MFPNPADGLCADRAHGTVGAARRRRDRRLRAFLKHESMTVAMKLATIQHHSYLKSGVVNVGVQVGSPLAPVTEYVAPAQVPPIYSTTTVTTDLVYPQFSSTAVVPSAPCVVGSLPPVDEFTGPVHNQVLQEHIAASEFTEKFAEFPVVQEQVIVQGIPGVIALLPPVEEFTGPVHGQVHQKLVSSSEMTENFAEIPVVHEQVIVGLRPERLVDALGPQGGLERAAPPCAVVPSLSLPSLGDDAGHDVTSTQFLLRCALAQRERERVQEAEIELFSQSARLNRAVEGKWELEGDGDAKLFHNSVTGLSRFIFAF